MNDEIKEIIDIEKYRNKDGYVEDIILLPNEIDKLLDYITNLQDLLNKTNDELVSYVDRCIELEEENEKLKERCEYLERSNNRREDEIMSLRDECVDGETYKSRNEKAIEYITSEETINMFISINAREKWLKINHKLLNILQGEDKNDK